MTDLSLMPLNSALNRLRGAQGHPEHPGRLNKLLSGDPYQVWRALIDQGHDPLMREYTVAKLGELPTLSHMIWCALSLRNNVHAAAKALQRCGFNAYSDQRDLTVLQCEHSILATVCPYIDCHPRMNTIYGWEAHVAGDFARRAGQVGERPPMGNVLALTWALTAHAKTCRLHVAKFPSDIEAANQRQAAGSLSA